MVKYFSGSVFNASYGSAIAHAVSCKGVWGAGIALQIRERFPKAYEEYNQLCNNKGSLLIGSCHVTKLPSHDIVSLFTSKGYGRFASDPKYILYATSQAIESMEMYLDRGSEVNIPKINSGLFRVPWEDTEDILKDAPFIFNVWIPEE